MPTDTKLKELIINELTEEQYKALTPNDDELYLTPDGSITKNENGSYVLDGDVDITGTTKLNSGLKPIAEYRFATGKLMNYGTFEGHEDILILGLEDDEGNYNCLGLGYFTLENQKVVSLSMTGFDYNNDDILYYSLSNNGTIETRWYAKSSDTQQKLYTHTLTLTADKSYTLIYDSTYNLNVSSLDDLRNMMDIDTTSDNIILPICATDLSNTAVLQITNSLCKIGNADVTAISDKVTPKA